MNTDISIFWHRRDLRINDNTGLFHALNSSHTVLPLFIFDTSILDQLEDRSDARVTFIYHCIVRLKREYEKHGGSLLIEIGTPLEVFRKIIKKYSIKEVYTNTDYEPSAIRRDKEIQSMLHQHSVSFHSFKDHVIFEKREVVKQDNSPYTVFTPYMKAWKEKYLTSKPLSYPSEISLHHLFHQDVLPLPSLKKIGFKASDLSIPSAKVPISLIRQYDKQRDFPAIKGTSHLGIHFRFGTISIRQKVKHAAELNEVFLNELIWRDFYQMIIFHFPHAAFNSFKQKYDTINWENNEQLFEKWCEGKTGYPIVDAGMRELNATGFMHNRVRMIVASFLSKHLLIDWRWGEAYFAIKLLDYELASNVGGWQWAAGCGCDAAPYFRVFNPMLQAEKFDPQQIYIKKWVAEFGTALYPKPIVEHVFARNRAIAAYKKALS
ncbi:MAG TPA: deoxyribodipyrimidine photo-lyase [Cytophagaceae bacterium]|jgi:deoxyribodipyrimidine photo-lyase|nr:deoxyribodipyrimidine photo-lyase [Cytophagaceae bacterium]